MKRRGKAVSRATARLYSDAWITERFNIHNAPGERAHELKLGMWEMKLIYWLWAKRDVLHTAPLSYNQVWRYVDAWTAKK